MTLKVFIIQKFCILITTKAGKPWQWLVMTHLPAWFSGFLIFRFMVFRLYDF